MTDQRININYYGLHKEPDSDVEWLIQDNDPQNIFGLSKNSCPFELSNKKLNCPHGFKIDDGEKLQFSFKKGIKPLMDNEIFKYVSPIPYNEKHKAVYIRASRLTDIAAINYLQLISNPIINCHAPVKTALKHVDRISKILGSSNLARYSISGFDYDHIDSVAKLAHATINCNGRLIMIGEKFPMYGFHGVIKFLDMDKEYANKIVELSDYSHEFKKLGNYLLTKYLKGEKVLNL